MERSFNTLAELRSEIAVLRARRDLQEAAIQEKFDGAGATFKTVLSLFKSTTGKKSFLEDFISQDVITNISRVVLPVLLNGSIFRNSGFFTKTLVTMFSQKAAKKINMDALTEFVDKIKEMFKSRRTHEKAGKDYGIPPDSETY